uniref:Uncharacterized protein n=1 Tax=viral metagenome TaxID=1070528 RepID=A0A6M3LG89_9ZZZZ
MATYDQWRLATPPYCEAPPDVRCDECGAWWEECTCEDGPREYTRADYEADRADDEISEGRNL